MNIDAAAIPTRWGIKGHYLVHKEACEALPETMPDFFRQAEDRIVALASQPDRWKSDSLPYLVGATRPDHYLAYELIQDKPLAPDRFAAIIAADKAGLKPVQVGLLPYRVAELYQNLTADFALWRNEVGQRGNSALAQELQESAIYDAGNLGHYIGDASQPLHATIHVNGWRHDVPNPHGYRTTPGIHREFETEMLNHVAIDPQAVAQKMSPPQTLQGDPLQWAVGLIKESNSQVERLYQLEQTGDLKPDQPSPKGIDFAEERLAKGASNLRDLWVNAWRESEALAVEMAKDKPRSEFD